MSTLKSIHGVVGLAVLALASGCGGGSGSAGGGGSSVDFTALHAQYTAPSGTLDASDVVKVGAAISKQQQGTGAPVLASAKVGLIAVPGGITIQSPTQPMCGAPSGDVVDCTCPGGGSFTESGISSSGGVVQATLDYNACVFTEGGGETATTNGSISFADYQSPQEMIIYSGTIDETITPPGTTTQIEMNFALVNGVMTYSVTVASGNVLVSESGSWDEQTETGTLTVTDRSTTWTCNLTNGSGTCTGTNGQTFSI
jgi:hypothetical protein